MTAGGTGDGRSALRVGLVIRNLRCAGTSRHVVRLCRAVDPATARLELFVLNRRPDDLRPLVPDHVPVHVLGSARYHPRNLLWLSRQLRRRRIDLAHSFLWVPDAYNALSGALARVPVVCSERGDRRGELYSLWRRLYDRRLTFRRAALVCANSRCGERLLIAARCASDKIRVIPNGIDLPSLDAVEPVDLRRELGWPASAKIVGAVGRLDRIKRIEVLIEGLARLPERLEAHGVVVGSGPERRRLERLAERRGMDRRIAFVGSRMPVEGLIKGFDVGVLLSRSEHCPNCILEYMSCAKPVIATRAGGIPELVLESRTGLLIDVDRPDQLSAALGSLLEDPERAAALGRAGRARVRDSFDIDTVASSFVELWHGVARPNGEPALGGR